MQLDYGGAALTTSRMVVAPFQTALREVSGARLVLSDIPYNLGFNYGPVPDDLPEEEYSEVVRSFLTLSNAACLDDAHMVVIHYPEHFARYWNLYCGETGWRFHQWVTWTYNGHTPNPTTDRLRRSHRAVLWLVKGAPRFFVDRGQRDYRNPNDRRIKARIKAGLTGARATDVFHVEQVKQGSKEHKGYSNQIPQALLRPFVAMTTEPGELVLDPFAGTGSTARAALALGRRAFGCDANPEAARFWADLGTIQGVLA